MLSEWAIVASVLVGAALLAAGPLGLLTGLRRYFDSLHFVVSLPFP